MAWADRSMGPDSGRGNFTRITPVVKWLLIFNIGIYVLDLILKGDDLDGPLRTFGAFTVRSGMSEGRIWEFFTFQFLHGSVGHILMNSVGLFIFGPWLERWWGAEKFLGFYLLSGAGGALFYALLISVGILPDEVIGAVDNTGNMLMVSATVVPLIGASAGIYGILAGVAVIAPSLVVTLLFPPISLTMRQLALAAMGISILFILFGIGGNEGGEAGHLGGALAGFLLIRSWIWWQKSERSPMSGSKRRGPRTDIEAKIRPRTMVDLSGESEIDAILDKISKDGFQSITQEERDILLRASENNNKGQ
ncbi:MAG: rhomboid family intramembrane serine protease [Verrucomicrobia bacterium]|nr:rhomboid family intramembrane serine protease [Verrucomicrobiota bacterium]